MPIDTQRILGAIRKHQPCTPDHVAEIIGECRGDVRTAVLDLWERRLVNVGADRRLRCGETG